MPAMAIQALDGQYDAEQDPTTGNVTITCDYNIIDTVKGKFVGAISFVIAPGDNQAQILSKQTDAVVNVAAQIGITVARNQVYLLSINRGQ